MAPEFLSHPMLKAVSTIGTMAFLPGMAWVAPVLTELDGVPEQLALRTLAMDTEWSWSFLGLAVLAAMFVALGLRRDKD